MRAKSLWDGRRGTWGRIAFAVVGAMLVQTSVAGAVQAQAKTVAVAPKANLGHPVAVTPVPMKSLQRQKPPANYVPTATHWPTAATSALPLVAAGRARSSAVASKQQSAAGAVWGQAVTPTKGGYSGPTSLGVKVLSHAAAAAVGVSGVLAEVTPSGGGRGTVRVGVDYAAFAQAYGGDYPSRLQLVELPACALTTPQLAACRTRTQLPSTNDTASQAMSTTVTLGQAPAAAKASGQVGAAAATRSAVGSGAMVIALTSSTSPADGGGAGGQYGATSLKASGSWTAGSSSGAFDYTYPIQLPPAISSLAPTVDLSYDSGSVDGETAATQAQSSWVGDGWSTADSYVEQSYVNCSDAPEGVTLPSAEQTDDSCYDGPVLTLSLGGSSASLIQDSSGNWHTTDDNGDVVKHVTGSGNGSGTYNTDYWTVTDRSGTVYEFGRNELPGWSSGKATTNSVDSEPVYSANKGDPCYSSSGFSASVCTMAYRWHLDYVKDLHGNAMAYYYTQATNYYGEDKGAHEVSYVRDSYLSHIDYGFTDGNAYGTPADRVAYTPGERCLTGTCDPIASNQGNWPDVPTDLICASGATCSSYGPAFFSTVRLTNIAAEQYNGTTYVTVDNYALGQTIPTTGTYNTSTLQLDSVTRTGEDTTGGSSTNVALPAETFGYEMMANRVNYTSGTGSGLGPMNRYRLTSVTTDSGSVISVVYELVTPCTATSIATLTPSTNTASCFPVEWTPPSAAASPSVYTDWFNKYSVESVSQSDPSGGSAGLFTAYKYPGGAGAWHYDDNEVVQAKYRTYGQWRGFGDVQTFTGQGTDPLTESEVWYYRGMDGDWLSSTSTRSVSLTDSQHVAHTDSNQLAGDVLESATYTYDGGPVDHSIINSYWVSAPTATRTRTGLPALTANAVQQVETWSRQAITGASPASWQTTETDNSYDTNTSSPTFGMVLYTYKHGDLSLAGTAASQETCTQTTYAPANTALNLTGLAAETEVDDKPCGGTSPAGASAPTAAQTNALTAPTTLNRATDVISDTRTFYDNPTMAETWPQPSAPTWPQSAPTVGDSSVVQVANGYNGSAFTYQTKSASTFDTYGRPTSSWDGNGNQTTFVYSDTSYLTNTQIQVTNPLSQATTTVFDPERALPVLVTDANNVVTTLHVDALGRTIAVWKDSRATKSAANELISYAYPAGSTVTPVVVTTQTLNDESGYSTSTTLYDALMRVRQTQTQAVSSAAGRIITDTFYDSHGWTYKSNANYWDNTSSPNGTLVQVADNLSQQQTLTSHDGLGRPTVVTSLDDSQVKQTSYTQYLGDSTVTVPPTGGTATATVSDALGRTTELDQYTTAPTVTTSTTGGFTTATVTGGTTQATKYTFNAQGRAYQTIDSQDETWATGYNFLGQSVSKVDPDAGSTPAASPTLYDGNGNVLQSTDSAGITQSFTYDKLNRKTAEYDATVAGQSASNMVASWAYDNSNNLVSGMTDPIGQLTTQYSYTPAGTFKVQAKGFNVFGESLGETYTVPGTSSLAGTYAYQHTYTPTTGLPRATLIPAAGGMAAEAVTIGYCAYSGLDEPCTLGGTNGYTQNVAYTDLGQVAQEVVGSATNQASVSNTFDPLTGALTDENIVNTAVSSTPMDDTSYGYDPSGNLTSQTDVRGGTATETQCYTYDPLDRLSSAWTTASTASSCPTAPTPANVATTVGDGITGSAYWTSWTYDPLGQPQTQTQHSLTGGNDTSIGYKYGGSATGCAASTGAHTLTTATTTTGTTSAVSSYCYDQLGDTTSRTTTAGQQTLQWNDEGQLYTASTGSNTTDYYYDASGNVVERVDPNGTTLFLPDQQITLATTGNVLGNTRAYPLPGGGQVVITPTAYGFEFADTHDTGTVSLDSTTANPSWQQETPYGAPRGAAAGSSWLDPNGYLDKPQDPSDSLTTIGAREYDTALGRFISLDPALETTSPQQLNGYTYAADNPTTGSDPTGLMLQSMSDGDEPVSLSVLDQLTPNPSPSTPGATEIFPGVMLPNNTTHFAAVRQDFYKLVAQDCEPKSIECLDPTSDYPGAGTDTANGMLNTALLSACADERCSSAVGLAYKAMMSIASLTALVGPDGHAGRIGEDQINSLVKQLGGQDPQVANWVDFTESDENPGCGTNSFAPSTQVLLADGKTKSIKNLKDGDKVEAADPATGKPVGPEPVTATMVNYDHNLVDITIDTGHGHTAVLHTTTEHPFWDNTLHAWINAAALTLGHALATVGTHPTATVESVTPTFGAADRYNLTIQQLHTYYVLAGTTPVLVHNSSSCPTGRLSDPLPRGMNNKIAAAYDLVKSGQLTSHDIYSGREYPWWAGSEEYRVPGRPDSDRILVKTLPNGDQVFGWTSTHYQKIQKFSAPQFPDSGW